MKETWKLVIAAGGTGGHITPALAIGEHLARVQPSCRIEYVCGSRPVEADVYRKAGITPHVMEILPFQRGWLKVFANFRRFRRSLKAARDYLAADPPRAALGMGGYVCAPLIAAAAALNIPTLIHEQNAVAGRANRWLSRRVRAIACGYPEAARAFPADKTVVTGNPIRPESYGADRAAARARWQLSPDQPTLLISGGSQGARRLNQFAADALQCLDSVGSALGPIQVLWSCGEANFAELNESLTRRPPRRLTIRLEPFIVEMGLAYAAADLAFCRAGAMTLAELTANALPAILVPLPRAVGDHQRRNALPMAQAGCAVIIEESELNALSLAEQWAALLADPVRLSNMRNAAQTLGRPRAVEEIVAILLRLKGEKP
ncbi:MAG: undecaprenyldiphospho-muramoylpentapeptide beta-N-acetylglucosaminyltransferase [Candidatus Sumerlaeia bacterium]|nr:undecaprenyldiphospho-muramoylpentapeptide beta-N-acetylglucosaminyltransferase [Candidatus Sumerlaeia bacterium]